jgi:Fe-S cluster biogenesis protein NfuA
MQPVAIQKSDLYHGRKRRYNRIQLLTLPDYLHHLNIMTDRQHLISRIEDALTTIRPHLQVDGGDVELVELTDDMHVKIKWLGMCESCNMSAMTLRAGIQEAIRGNVPEVVGVEAVNGI